MRREKTLKGHRLASVFRLADYHKPALVTPKPLLFYINNKDELRKKLEKVSTLSVFSIQSMPDLHMALTIKTPELILIEADLKWCPPLSVLHETQRFFDAPSVLFCKDRHNFSQKDLIRDAYKSGVYDVLFSPLNTEDLSASLNLILRLAL